MDIEDKKIKEKLLEIYPDGVVNCVTNHHDIYNEIKKRLSEKK